MLIRSQSEVRLHTRRCVHFHPVPFTRLSFSILAPRLQSNPHGLLSFMGALPRKQNLAVEVKVQLTVDACTMVQMINAILRWHNQAYTLSIVSCPDPTYERGSGDIRLIPRASLMLITFRREISLHQSYCRNTICSATPEILGYFGTMTQHFFWRVN